MVASVTSVLPRWSERTRPENQSSLDPEERLFKVSPELRLSTWLPQSSLLWPVIGVGQNSGLPCYPFLKVGRSLHYGGLYVTLTPVAPSAAGTLPFPQWRLSEHTEHTACPGKPVIQWPVSPAHAFAVSDCVMAAQTLL